VTRIKPIVCAIITITLIVSVCGCAGREVTNSTTHAAGMPSARETARVGTSSHAGAGASHASAPTKTVPKSSVAPATSPKDTLTSVALPALVTGTSFPCVHATPDHTSTGVVTKVVDGDTIRVRIGGHVYRVRYIGMNAPEDTKKEEWMGPEATARDKALVAGKSVTLVKDVSETDRYGRLLRFVFVDNTMVNLELVREGYARATPYWPDISCEQLFYHAQQQARSEHRGLWAAGAAS